MTDVRLSRFQRHGDAPFGKPFAYTDATDLPGHFSRIDKLGRYHECRAKLPWYRRIFRRKPPVAWATPEVEPSPKVSAHMMHTGSAGEVRVSAVVNPGFIVPLYNDQVLLQAKVVTT